MKFLISNLRLLVRRFKSVAVINVVGLGVAFAVMLVVAMQVTYDLNYDCGYRHADEIFAVETGTSQGTSLRVTYTMSQLWKESIPEIRGICLREDFGDYSTSLRREGAGTDISACLTNVMFVTRGFLDVFTPEIVAGNGARAFETQGRCLISETVAAAIFGGDNPVGQVLVNPEQPDATLTVDAVYRDFPEASSIGNGVFTRIEEDRDTGNPSNYWWRGYVRLDPADRGAALAKMNEPEFLKENFGDDSEIFHLTGLSDYYLTGGVGGNGHLPFMMYLVVIGLVILVIAIINFINLSMAMAPSRVRNVNIHRILGIGRRSLRISLSMEAVAMAAVAAVGGCVVVHWFSSSVFTGFFTADLTLADNIPVVAACFVGLLAVALLVGAYSSRYATSFDVAIAIKSSFALSRQGAGLRNTLVVVQFTAAIFFICFASFIRVQYNHMSTHSTGHEKENIVFVPAFYDAAANASLTQEFKRNPGIVDVTITNIPGNIGSQRVRTIGDKSVSYQMWHADERTIDFLGIELVAGENFRAGDYTTPQLIFNRELLRRYGLGEDIVGTRMADGYTVVGIVEDVNIRSLHSQMEPMAFQKTGTAPFVLIKISEDNAAATLKFIEDTWRGFSLPSIGFGANEFSLNWLDEWLGRQYSYELNTSQLIGVLGLMAVAIAVMGVFGLIMFNTRYKTREIAIRKVNGATVGGIALMLNRGMLVLVGVAFVLAVPLTLVFITRWVEGFAYKADVPWWLFPSGGTLVLLIAVATVSWQSWRAATANPIESLKSE